MNEEHREEQQVYAGLTTAALAGAGESTSLNEGRELPENGRGQVLRASGTSTRGSNSLPVAGTAAAAGEDEHAAQLLSPDEAKEFRVRWDTIQGGFVDEPRRAVEQADNLVAGAMKRLAEILADERSKLEGQWEREDSASTEDLRLALRRYRAFFGRLLSV
jgi:hypothetical protein